MASAKRLVKYYTKGAVLPVEEDMTHEFKGHRNLCVEDLPPWTQESKFEKASRKAISKNLNAFLNSGSGGTVYLGVVDNGKVHGLKMTQLQKEHFLASLNDLMARYTPPVSSHRYKVRFVPVVSKDCSKEDILRLCSFDSTSPDTSSPDKDQGRKHVFRTPNYCWCDKEAVAQYNNGVVAPDYVVEIVIKPWKPDDPRNRKENSVDSITNTCPLHSDEEGKIYFRRHASLIQYPLNTIVQMTRSQVKEVCETEIARLTSEIAALKQGSV